MAGAALAVLCLGTIVAACAPVKEPVKEPPPEQPPPPPPPPGLEPPDSPLPPGSPSLSFTNVVTGLANPWDMSFLNDGTMFFTERQEGVSVKVGDTVSAPVTPPNLATGEGGQGVMGLDVLEPGVVPGTVSAFVCYTTPGDVRVVRYDYNATTGLFVNALAPAVVLSGITKGFDHNGCRIRFGPDGLLYIGTGDANIGTAPQDTSNLAGKVLRVTSGGSPASGNPFGNAVYTYGHRNVQGIAFSGSQVYSVEHGSAIDDEVNLLVAGGNGGWNPVGEGGLFPGYDGHDTDPPMTDFSLPDCCMAPVWKSGQPTVAPSGGTVVTGGQWGSWNGALIVAFLKDSQARVMVLNGAGGVASSSPFLGGFGRLRSVVQGPDGNLYVSTDNGAGDVIVKVTPS